MRKILDLVPKRGPEAFDKFYEALLLTNNGTVADMLKPELAATRPRDSGQIGYAAVPQETELPASMCFLDVFLFVFLAHLSKAQAELL